MSQNPLYIFLHLHKCAGNTLVIQLRENFAPEEIVSLYNFEDETLTNRDIIRERLSSLSPEQRTKLKVIFGHEVYYGLHELFPDREVRYITFLRHPIKRTVSHYNFYRTQFADGKMSEHFKPDIYRAGAILTFPRWVREIECYHNFIFRHFYSHFFNEELFDGGRDVQVEAEGLDQIKKILDQFYFVGLTENPADFLFIYRQLGFKKFLLNQNISRKYFKLEDHPENRSLIIDINHFDQAIYDYGVQLNQRFKENHPSFDLEVTRTRLARIFNPTYIMAHFYNYSAKLKKLFRAYVKLINRIKGIQTKA